MKNYRIYMYHNLPYPLSCVCTCSVQMFLYWQQRISSCNGRMVMTMEYTMYNIYFVCKSIHCSSDVSFEEQCYQIKRIFLYTLQLLNLQNRGIKRLIHLLFSCIFNTCRANIFSVTDFLPNLHHRDPYGVVFTKSRNFEFHCYQKSLKTL